MLVEKVVLLGETDVGDRRLGKLLEERPELVDGQGVSNVVEDRVGRPGEQEPGEREPLLLARRECVDRGRTRGPRRAGRGASLPAGRSERPGRRRGSPPWAAAAPLVGRRRRSPSDWVSQSQRRGWCGAAGPYALSFGEMMRDRFAGCRRSHRVARPRRSSTFSTTILSSRPAAGFPAAWKIWATGIGSVCRSRTSRP